MKINWEEVKPEHVLEAIRKYDLERPDHPRARNTFLIYEGKKYPAKHIRGMAYKIAFNKEVSKEEYSGGKETERFFKKMGFTVQYKDTEKYKMDELNDKSAIEPDNKNDIYIHNLFDWRSFEIEMQRIKLNYLKWLFYFNPPLKEEILGCGIGDNFTVLDSDYGRSFSAFPSGSGSVYVGGRKGSAKLSKECFVLNENLSNETVLIKNSLNKRNRELKNITLKELSNGNNSLVWAIIQNYFWIKVGMHEYMYDVNYAVDKESIRLEEYDIRDYILMSMSFGIDASKKTPNFSANQIKHLLKYQFKWDSYACCAYDCGPIAWGKDRYYTYSEVVLKKSKYNKNHVNLYFEAIEEDKKKGSYNFRRDYAVKSLADIYEYACLYHREPLNKVYRYKDFVLNESLITQLIISVQERINSIIDEEKLDLVICDCIPK